MSAETGYDQQALLGQLASERRQLQHSAHSLQAPLAKIDELRHALQFLQKHWPLLLAGSALAYFLYRRSSA